MKRNTESVARVSLPGVDEGFSLAMSDDLCVARAKALERHRLFGRQGELGHRMIVPGCDVIDAETWATRAADEDWLVWRARRCARRLERMPISVEPEELLVGKPRFVEPGIAFEPDAEAAAVLAEVPRFPGGDTGHFHPDYETLFEIGIGGIIERIGNFRARDGIALEQRTFYDACETAMRGMTRYAARVAGECERTAGGPGVTEEQAGRLRESAAVCRKVAVSPLETFHEAIQLMFLAQVCLWFGEDHGLTSPGRLDRTLNRFYEADLAAGRISRREAFELICSLYIHMNNVLGPGSAVAAMVGGRDAAGRDVTNEITYLALAARQATKLVYPTVALAWHKDTPDELMEYAIRMLASGVGDPALFNDELISLGLQDHGVSAEDSCNYMNSTCVEIKVVGCSNMWVTAPYFNLAQALLDGIGRAVDGEAGTFNELQAHVRSVIAEQVEAAAQQRHGVWLAREERGCFPLASCFIRDCLEKGEDYDRGGARYNWVENSFVGLANLVDGSLAIRELVYGDKAVTLAELKKALDDDYQGHEALRQRILSTVPSYGNDDDTVDALAVAWADFLVAETERHTVGRHRYVPGFFCWVQHERLGSETGATPDGRRAGMPLADGAGAAQGKETKGPTASVLSTTKWSHRPVLGGLVHNIKFSDTILNSASALDAARRVVETYMLRGGFEIQVNVVGTETLLAARRNPEEHRDLLVRVAGYSDYFVHLNEKMQDEVIARSTHEL